MAVMEKSENCFHSRSELFKPRMLIFLDISAPLSLLNVYQMNLFSAWSISMDSL